MTTVTTAVDTGQFVELDTKSGKAFLRRVIRGGSNGSEEWCLRADSSDEWRIRFTRTIEGEAGEPDVYVTVATDARIAPQRKSGAHRSFSDSEEVIIPLARYICVTMSTATVAAQMLLAGSRLHIQQSSGSTSSSRLGLAFLDLEASIPGCGYGTVTLDSTVFANGRQIISGSIST